MSNVKNHVFQPFSCVYCCIMVEVLKRAQINKVDRALNGGYRTVGSDTRAHISCPTAVRRRETPQIGALVPYGSNRSYHTNPCVLLDLCAMARYYTWLEGGPQLLAGGPLGLLDFVLCALYDPRNCAVINGTFNETQVNSHTTSNQMLSNIKKFQKSSIVNGFKKTWRKETK